MEMVLLACESPTHHHGKALLAGTNVTVTVLVLIVIIFAIIIATVIVSIIAAVIVSVVIVVIMPWSTFKMVALPCSRMHQDARTPEPEQV